MGGIASMSARENAAYMLAVTSSAAWTKRICGLSAWLSDGPVVSRLSTSADLATCAELKDAAAPECRQTAKVLNTNLHAVPSHDDFYQSWAEHDKKCLCQTSHAKDVASFHVQCGG